MAATIEITGTFPAYQVIVRGTLQGVFFLL